jgi:23S rRNA (uridine2552-2'-O)-methyltransferase
MARPSDKKGNKKPTRRTAKKPARNASSGSSRGAPKKPKTPLRTLPKQSDAAIAGTALGEVPEKRVLSKALKADADQLARRSLHTRVKSAKGRKLSSTLWLERQLNDPYVARARAEGYRSRAAYKLIDIEEKFKILKKGARIVDLGAAPGGWCQVASKKIGAKGRVVGIDYLEMPAIENVQLLQMDFNDPAAPDALKKMIAGPVDIVLSDMAAPTTGHKQTDHMSIMALCEAGLEFAEEVLVPGGVYVAKTFQGGATGDLLVRLKKLFTKVVHFKPKSSRQDSAEMYVVAMGFRKEKKR